MTSNLLVGNEAELQARLENQLRKALPLLPAEIRMERHLHLRLGHHKVLIDGMESEAESKRGRYDILVLAEDKPLLLAEIKAPDVEITDDDVGQAISYARVHEPMVPLVFVSNGSTSMLLRTIDREPVDPMDVEPKRLAGVLAGASALSASASEDAVRTLLGASLESWIQILGKWSNDAIQELTGSVREFLQPIASEFEVPRTAVQELESHLTGGRQIVVLHGPPLSGVTNALAQLCRKIQERPILYVKGVDVDDILQSIASRLSRELSYGVSKDDLRHWFNTGCGQMKVTLVLDGVPETGIDELVQYARAGVLCLVLGLNSDAYTRLSTVPGRNESSALGRAALDMELKPFNDDEFCSAENAINESFGAMFFNGARHVPELRWPRNLRIIAATLPRKIDTPPSKDGYTAKHMVPPILGPKALEACADALVTDPETKFNLGKLATAFLEDVNEHASDPDWLVATWGRPSVNPDILQRVLGEGRLERLRSLGFISWMDIGELGPRLLIRIEELLLHHVAHEWVSQLLATADDSTAICKHLDTLIAISELIPGGEIALATAIFQAAQEDPQVLSASIHHLISKEPTTSKLTQGSRVELLVTDAKIRFEIDEGMDKEVVGNMQPWLVLSHLSSWPMERVGHDETVNLSIFAMLGKSKHLLYRARPTALARVPGFHFHDVKGAGPVLCLSTGIVEPLLQAMLSHAHLFPDELLMLAEYATEEEDAQLAWRVLTTATLLTSATDEKVAISARQAVETLKPWWDDALERAAEDANAPTP